MGWVVGITPRPRFTPGERTPGTHWTGGWVGPRAGLDTEVRGKILLPLSGIEPRSPGRPVRSQKLHWLSYPAPIKYYKNVCVYVSLFIVGFNFIQNFVPPLVFATSSSLLLSISCAGPNWIIYTLLQILKDLRLLKKEGTRYIAIVIIIIKVSKIKCIK
jgi:hypothetical protein